eukprot:4721941-Alexandrium_andersonii.AAC.1
MADPTPICGWDCGPGRPAPGRTALALGLGPGRRQGLLQMADANSICGWDCGPGLASIELGDSFCSGSARRRGAPGPATEGVVLGCCLQAMDG